MKKTHLIFFISLIFVFVSGVLFDLYLDLLTDYIGPFYISNFASDDYGNNIGLIFSGSFIAVSWTIYDLFNSKSKLSKKKLIRIVILLVILIPLLFFSFKEILIFFFSS